MAKLELDYIRITIYAASGGSSCGNCKGSPYTRHHATSSWAPVWDALTQPKLDRMKK